MMHTHAASHAHTKECKLLCSLYHQLTMCSLLSVTFINQSLLLFLYQRHLVRGSRCQTRPGVKVHLLTRSTFSLKKSAPDIATPCRPVSWPCLTPLSVGFSVMTSRQLMT